IDHTAPDDQNLRVPQAQPLERSFRVPDLRRGPRPLDRQHDPARLEQAHGQRCQPVKGCHRPCGHHIHGQLAGHLPRPGPPRPRTHPPAHRATHTEPTKSKKNPTRRSIGSSRTTSLSGNNIASTIPGNPAPDPRSTSEHPCGTNSATTALFSRCRSQIRGTSLGPISPRSTPTPASSRANCSACPAVSPQTY